MQKIAFPTPVLRLQGTWNNAAIAATTRQREAKVGLGGSVSAEVNNTNWTALAPKGNSTGTPRGPAKAQKAWNMRVLGP